MSEFQRQLVAGGILAAFYGLAFWLAWPRLPEPSSGKVTSDWIRSEREREGRR